jgi:hypothetical protein
MPNGGPTIENPPETVKFLNPYRRYSFFKYKKTKTTLYDPLKEFNKKSNIYLGSSD